MCTHAVAIVCYTTLAVEFLTRYVKDVPLHFSASAREPRVKTTGRMKLMLFGMAAMTVFIFIRYVHPPPPPFSFLHRLAHPRARGRSIYRTIELSDGFNGKVAETQWLFSALLFVSSVDSY